MRLPSLALVALLIGVAGRPAGAAPIAELSAPIVAQATAPVAAGQASMTITVVPRSESGVFRGTTLVSLDGTIDTSAPDRLSRALDGAQGPIAVWLNSPGGNLFAGMQLGRLIRKHGGSTHIIDSRTLRPGECYSACSLAFLGGVARFNDNGARYGVHRASIAGTAAGERDLGQDLSTVIESYIREMGVDARLFDLWVKAGPDEMYILSRREARELGVVNDGRMAPAWSVEPFPGGSRLLGKQSTPDGTSTVFFSCDRKQTVFGSIDQAHGNDGPADGRGWNHWLTIDGDQGKPLKPLDVSNTGGLIHSTFILPADLVRRAMSAKQIGHRMSPSKDPSRSLGDGVDVDDRSASMVRNFLRSCLRERTK
jgi:hypothetical protein